MKPKWLALDDNSLGYDILSYTLDADGVESPLHIEVKSTASGGRRIFLTRNAWKVATSMPESFALYFWELQSTSLTVLRVDDIRSHVPIDQGAGRWSLF